MDEFINKVTCSDALGMLSKLPDDSIDLLVSDPPYGIGFMGKDWDKALPDKKIWQECLRVLKDGAFAFVMSIPRADCLSRMIISLEDAGFMVNFTPIYWTYASGFPKAQNIGKAVDKRLGIGREVVGYESAVPTRPVTENWKASLQVNRFKGAPMPGNSSTGSMREITHPATPQAKALDGSYGGFQPKPSVEVIIVAMKPLSEKTYVDQALKNQKGITWLDNGRIPYESEGTIASNPKLRVEGGYKTTCANQIFNNRIGDQNFMIRNVETGGRFLANLLVSDDVLNDGRDRLSRYGKASVGNQSGGFLNKGYNNPRAEDFIGDSGSFSRYFDLDKWFEERIKQLPVSVQKTFPFLIVPKASKSEKNKGCEDLPESARRMFASGGRTFIDGKWVETDSDPLPRKNNHPTVKPLKLMSYLITLGSREGDIVLDPFAGSFTTALAAQMLGRQWISCDISEEYCKIGESRLSQIGMI